MGVRVKKRRRVRRKNGLRDEGLSDPSSKRIARNPRERGFSDFLSVNPLHRRQARRAERQEPRDDNRGRRRVNPGGLRQVPLLLVELHLVQEQLAQGIEGAAIIQMRQMITGAVLVQKIAQSPSTSRSSSRRL